MRGQFHIEGVGGGGGGGGGLRIAVGLSALLRVWWEEQRVDGFAWVIHSGGGDGRGEGDGWGGGWLPIRTVSTQHRIEVRIERKGVRVWGRSG